MPNKIFLAVCDLSDIEEVNKRSVVASKTMRARYYCKDERNHRIYPSEIN